MRMVLKRLRSLLVGDLERRVEFIEEKTDMESKAFDHVLWTKKWCPDDVYLPIRRHNLLEQGDTWAKFRFEKLQTPDIEAFDGSPFEWEIRTDEFDGEDVTYLYIYVPGPKFSLA